MTPLVPVAALTAGLGLSLSAAGTPAASLFAGLLAGLAFALVRPGAAQMPARLGRAAQAVTGVALGVFLQTSTLGALAQDWLAVTLVTVAALGLSLVGGIVLAYATELDGPTAALGSIAGGASGIVGMADELGADDRLVALMQYLRVLVVVLVTPFVLAVAFPASAGGAGASAGGSALGSASGWVLTGLCCAAGALLAARLRLPAALLGPMLAAGVLGMTWPGLGMEVPPVLRETAFAAIGLQVGLGFTLATVRQAGRLLVPVLAAIVVLVVASFALAVLLAATTSASLADAYLATTPGGLVVVAAAAVGPGMDTTLIVAMQTVRMVLMVLVAPIAARRLKPVVDHRRPLTPRGATQAPSGEQRSPEAS